MPILELLPLPLTHVAGEQKRGQLEEDTCLSLLPADTWQGIALTTLLHVELHRKPA